ncbi:hypothetical protein [Streptomyces sp. NPDC047718]|uniref:hypothetical protein n=1 Tax=Streptomyces sp. NPDC047718 TaxID=3155479 RepID=UPI00340D3D4C
MTTTKVRVLLTAAMAVIGIGLAQTTAVAQERHIVGSTTSGCAAAEGNYGYEKVGYFGGYAGFKIWGELTTSKTCSYGLRLQMKGKAWDARSERWVGGQSWGTIASSVTSVDLDSSLIMKDVQFQICDYVSGATKRCTYVR